MILITPWNYDIDHTFSNKVESNYKVICVRGTLPNDTYPILAYVAFNCKYDEYRWSITSKGNKVENTSDTLEEAKLAVDEILLDSFQVKFIPDKLSIII